MIRWLTYLMVYLGSALMIYNIYGFVMFTRYIRNMKTWDPGNNMLNVPIVLLVSFLLGYLAVGILGKPDIVVAGILFGGSIFVFVMVRLLSRIIKKVIENEHLEAELLAAEESNRAKNSFLASISHEMRTPMNVILGMNALALKNPDVPAAAREQLEKAGHSARHLSDLIDNILTMQQAESGDLAMKSEPFSLKEALDQICAQVSLQCDEKGLAFETSFANCATREYTGDAAELKRVLLCILDNAVKYTDAPGTVRFLVKCTKAQDTCTDVRFIISDTGVGIDEAFLPQIFDSLTQEDASFTNRFGGSGMGLAVAHSVVERMGGSIEAVSEKGMGSTFTVILPLSPTPGAACANCAGCKPDQGACCANCGGCSAASIPAAEPAPISLEGRRVLIVEDIEENAEILMDLLELEDAQSEHAVNGQVAVQMVERSAPFYYDAILMDMRMPMMDGMEAARRIRAMERPDAGKLPIIAVTANAFESDVKNALDAGMNEHLAKPVDADKLYATLKKWIKALDDEREARR